MNALRRIDKQRMIVLIAGALLLGFVATIPLTGGAAPAPYAKGKITCPRSANRGETVSVTGSGLPGNAPVTFSYSNAGVGATVPTTTTSTGSFSTTSTIAPTSPTGTQTLTATIVGAGSIVVTKSCAIRIR